MRLDNGVEEKEVLVVGETDSYESTVDKEDMSFVLHILSSNLYSNSIGSLIREYTTNGWDAQKEVGKDKEPMIVSLVTDKDGTYWSIRDFGTGLSPELVKDVYSKFGKSTKRGTDDTHGCWGLGKYSGLSYTDNIHITSWVEGVKYYYLMYKAQVGIKIDKLYEEPSEEKSGTEIKVYLKDFRDKAKFQVDCRSQLAYFENIYFNGDIPNDYKIHQGEHYRCSTLYPLNEMHLTLGEVVYPIPWTELGLVRSSAPVAIKFKIGELAVTPNRESILIRNETKAIIEAKIVQAADEIVRKYNKHTSETEDVKNYFSSIGKDATVDLSGKHVRLADLKPYASENASTMSFKPLRDIFKYNLGIGSLMFPYEVHQVVKPFQKKATVGYVTSDIGISVNFYKKAKINYDYDIYSALYILSNYSKVFFTTGSLYDASSMVMRYIFETYGCDKIVAIRERHKLSNYMNYLNLSKFKKSTWRHHISRYQAFLKETILQMGIEVHDISKIQPTEDWLKMDRARRNKNFDYHQIRKANAKILIYKGREAERWNGRCKCVFEKEEIKIKDLLGFQYMTVYHSLKEKEEVANMAFFRSFHKMQYITTAEPNLKYFEQIPNCISYTKFMEGKNKIAGRVATAHIIRKFILENKVVFSDAKFVTSLSDSLGKKLEFLIDYVQRNTLNNPMNSSITHNNFADSLVEIVKKTRYFDYNALTILKEVEDKAPHIRFIGNLKDYYECGISCGTTFNFTKHSHIGKDVVDFAVEYIKLRGGFKLDSVFYTKEYMDNMKKLEQPSTIAGDLLYEKKLDDEIDEVNTELLEEEVGVQFVDDTELD